jgi:pantoate ligase / CMP/dCMP kinase
VAESHFDSFLSDTIGFVPTMGALHPGHASLIKAARQENQTVVVSIFVNPLQFGPHEDWERYPRPLEADCQLCEDLGVDAIFAPTPHALDINPKIAQFQVVPPLAMIDKLCGVRRPGHFQGVATIVMKLFQIVQPDRAYFGQKDAQQVAVLRQMVADLNMPVEVVVCPTVRETSGLAMSSRNQYLSPQERQQASLVFQALQAAVTQFKSGEKIAQSLIDAVNRTFSLDPTIQVEYIELVNPFTLERLTTIVDEGLLAVAVHLGSTRLIDNVVLRTRQPIIAIDGPAGAGKSTVARQVAHALNLLYLDSGAMYRAVTWLAMQQGLDLRDEPAIAELVSACQIELQATEHGLSVYINDADVTQSIRTVEVSAQVSTIAAQAAVRHELVKLQQQFGRRGGVVMEGRDIGTYVFPDAELKVFLTASVQERARRRQLDLVHQGQPELSLDDLEHAILERDVKDSTRSLAPLRKAADAIELSTDGLTIEQVIQQITDWYFQMVTR